MKSCTARPEANLLGDGAVEYICFREPAGKAIDQRQSSDRLPDLASSHECEGVGSS